MKQLTCQDGSTVKKNPYYEQIHISPDKENCIALATADYLPYEFSRPSPVTKKKILSSTGKRGSSKTDDLPCHPGKQPRVDERRPQ